MQKPSFLRSTTQGIWSARRRVEVVGLLSLIALATVSAVASGTGTVHAAEPTSGLIMDAGQFHSLIVQPDGSLWAFGSNWYGQLGTTEGLGEPVPTPTKTMTDVSRVAGGWGHSLVLKTDGSLWTFGYNRSGQLGTDVNNGTFSPNPVPTQAMTDVIEIATGDSFNLVVKSDGTLWTFGDNYKGQLGRRTNIGTEAANPKPAQVMTDAVAVAAGAQHSLVLKSDRTLWTFGDNTRGQLGTTANIGPTNANPTPTQVMTDVIAIAAGDTHSLALKSDGTLWTFGDNYWGQLGTAVNSGTKTANPTPTQVMTDVIAMAAGDSHSLALKSDGTLWAFGGTHRGQLGGTAGNDVWTNPTPTQVMTDVAAIAAGGSHSLAAKSDGTVWTFGSNYNGQLGATENLGVDVANPTPRMALLAGGGVPDTSSPVTSIGESASLTTLPARTTSDAADDTSDDGMGSAGWLIGAVGAILASTLIFRTRRRK